MNKLTIFVDERVTVENETKFKTIIELDNKQATQEIYLNQESIDKLKNSGKFIIEKKTFADKILDQFEKSKPEFCKD